MKRNVRKIIQAAKANHNYDMNVDEMNLLINDSKNDIYMLVHDAFMFGYALGVRAEKANKRA